MRKTVLAAMIAAMMMAGGSVSAAGSEEAMKPRVGALSEWQSLREDPAVLSVSTFSPDFAGLAKAAGSIRVGLAPGLELDATQTGGYLTADGMQVWEGVLTDLAKTGTLPTDIAFDPMNSVTLVNNKGRVTGTIRVDGALFRIRPLKGGGHVVIEVDEKAAPPDHPAGVSIPTGPLARIAGRNTTNDLAKSHTVIRVMSVATNSAISASGDIGGLVNLAIAEANQSYTNSGVLITLQAAGLYSTSYAESGSFSTDLARIRGTTDGYMDSIHGLRNTNKADMVMFVINNSSSCGLASAIGASATTAFAAVHWSCATGYYSFGHELGHLQAARHDPANDPTTTPYAYGHGYQYASGGWRTVMAYACSTSCTRINYWSNPSKTYGGKAMGTTSTHDNTRVLNNTRASIAAFRN